MKITKLISFLLILAILPLASNLLKGQIYKKLPANINKLNIKVVSPFVSFDEKHLVYLEKTEDSSHIVECIKGENENWRNPVRIDAINKYTVYHKTVESPSYNQDASEIYFSLKFNNSEDSSADIYLSKKVGGLWQEPVKLPSPVNSNKQENDPCISPDGKTLYFVRNSINDDYKKFNCCQIYTSDRTESGWTEPKLLPEPVNQGCDRSPRISADGKTLFLTSLREEGKGGADIYYAKQIAKNIWLSPINIDTLNTEYDELFPSVSFDGKTMFFQKGMGKRNNRLEKIYKAELPNQFISEKTVIIKGVVKDLKSEKPIPAKLDVIDPASSIVLYTAENNDSTGEYSLLLQRGKNYRIDTYFENYSHYFFEYDARNLKESKIVYENMILFPNVTLVLNIYDSEIYEPFIARIKIYDTENQSLLDIKAERKGKGRYNITLPIGKNYKIEAVKDHFETNSFELDLRGTVQFDEFERDIELQVKKIDYEIILSDAETGEGVETEIEIKNLTTGETIITKVKTDKNGKLKIKLRDGEKYEINVTPKGYAFYNTTVNLVDETVYKKEVKLEALKESTKIELKDINFESNSADLNESSYQELDRLVKLLKTNPEMKVEISAHTDDVGSSKYNLKLSEKRAKSVLIYLNEKGADENNLVSKGYGESKPAYQPFNTDENRAKNRRVELKIIKI